MRQLCAILLAGTLMALGACTMPTTNVVGGSQYVAAVRALDAGNKSEAKQSLQAAIQANPNLITPRIMLGDIYRADSEYDNARGQYEVVVRLDPYEPSNHYKLGITYQFLDKLNEAAASYKRTLELNPSDANAMMNLGLIALTQGRADEAQDLCEHATRLAPKSAAVWSNYGLVLAAQGQFAEAETAYRKSLDLNPDQPATMLNLGSNLIRQGKGMQAVAIMEEVVKKSDTPLSRKRYGDALAVAKKYDEAMEQYQLALKANPQYYQAWNEMAATRIEQYKAGQELVESQKADAIACWKRSLKINATQPKIQALVEQWEGRK